MGSWLQRHFALGIMISGTACSIIAWMLIEWKWPWFLAPLKHFVLVPWGWCVALFQWLAVEVPVSRWWYWTLVLYLLFTITFAAFTYLKSVVGDSVPHLNQYTKDMIFGVVWRWRWLEPEYVAYDLAPFCPHCDRRLSISCDEGLAFSHQGIRSSLHCREHGVIYRGSQSCFDAIELIVKDEISLKVRNGSWVEAMNAVSENNT